jgi:phosphoglycolate phosphatase-like HAD superfamily hydrolase
VRPVVEHGWEMPLLITALLSGVSETEILERWRPDALLDELRHSRREVAAVLDTVRDEWIAADEADWLDQHRFYPGTIERLRRLADGPTRVVVITTKEGRFARKLLTRQGVDLGVANVYGKEADRPKPAILTELAAPRFPARRLWFVEDRLKTLEAVKGTPGLDDVDLFLAGWGYNTPRDREAARRDDRVVLLSLERFAREFPEWIPSPPRHT